MRPPACTPIAHPAPASGAAASVVDKLSSRSSSASVDNTTERAEPITCGERSNTSADALGRANEPTPRCHARRPARSPSRFGERRGGRLGASTAAERGSMRSNWSGTRGLGGGSLRRGCGSAVAHASSVDLGNGVRLYGVPYQRSVLGASKPGATRIVRARCGRRRSRKARSGAGSVAAAASHVYGRVRISVGGSPGVCMREASVLTAASGSASSPYSKPRRDMVARSARRCTGSPPLAPCDSAVSRSRFSALWTMEATSSYRCSPSGVNETEREKILASRRE
mmetsp:Transcript_6655/g.20095  ORF Transcript_6655/g.20095 Transcript_6655/m.20095 type:complete len:283 (+) Transcript_6655:1796-2644(+)